MPYFHRASSAACNTLRTAECEIQYWGVLPRFVNFCQKHLCVSEQEVAETKVVKSYEMCQMCFILPVSHTVFM